MTMIIAVPTGVKVFNWLFTLYGGRIRFTVPIYWALGFMVTFVIGGMTGVLMAIPPADFVLHNSLFLIAHFHNTAIGGVVFGALAGYTYWFPKAFGFKLDERLGKAIFWCWFIGFYLAFMPLYALGLMGATRRMQHYPDAHWQPLMLVALCGRGPDPHRHRPDRGPARRQHPHARAAVAISPAIPGTGARSNGRRRRRRRPGISPFCRLSRARTPIGRPSNKDRQPASPLLRTSYVPLHVPRSNPTGVFLAFFAVMLGFALIWHIWWMAIAGLLGALAVGLRQAWRTDTEIRDFGGGGRRFLRAARVARRSRHERGGSGCAAS